MEGSQGTSYGGDYSGGEFDFIEFIKRPQTICRLLSILFAIVVFGCISAAGYDAQFHHCIFNKNSDACHYGVAIGVLAFLACLLFLAVDAQFNNISNSETRRHLVIADLGFSGIWSFLWFVGFCFLADQWRNATIKTTNETNHARAAIAFSFFSVFTWVTLTLMAYHRHRQGDGFEQEFNKSNKYQGGFPNTTAGEYNRSPYASFPHPGEDDSAGSYQQQPFGVPPQPFGVPPPQQPVKTEYNVPEY